MATEYIISCHGAVAYRHEFTKKAKKFELPHNCILCFYKGYNLILSNKIAYRAFAKIWEGETIKPISAIKPPKETTDYNLWYGGFDPMRKTGQEVNGVFNVNSQSNICTMEMFNENNTVLLSEIIEICATDNSEVYVFHCLFCRKR